MTSPVRLIVGSSAVTVLAMLPLFLLGALAVSIREELGFSETALGIAVSVFFLTSAIVSVPGGRLSDRLGARPSVLLASVMTVVAMLGIAALTTGWLTLALFLILAGTASGISQPAANLLLARSVPRRRQGLAFGTMKAAAPTASLLAGIAVPAIGLTVGWRWAFFLGSCVLVPIWLLLRQQVGQPQAHRPQAKTERIDATLLLPATALALASAGSSPLGVFFVESAVATGISLGTAGILLSVGSLAGIASRLTAGWLADRHAGNPMTGAMFLLAVGAVGLWIIAVADGFVGLAIGSVLAFGPGWSWPGLFNLAIVRHYDAAPGSAIGATQAGGHFGAVLSPPIFGVVASTASFSAAWSLMGVLMLASTLLLAATHRASKNRPG
ncbi:MAG: MFS transporter [Dehalococcoidia bacterium]